jgi:hypothetical protein
MPETIYLLCALSSVVCVGLLVRGWYLQRERLLVWSAVCFAALAVQNCILFVDLVLFPETDLTVWRNIVGLTGVASLMAGLIWET